MEAPDGIRLEQVGEQSQRLARSAWQYMQDCKAADNGYTAGLGSLEDLESIQAVEENWIPQVINETEGKHLPDGWVPAIEFCALNQDNQIVGMIQLRLELNDFLFNYLGNIGYSVHPDFRCRGYAHYMLHECLGSARQHGLDRVLVTCSVDNEGSRRTILSCGGRFEDTRLDPEEGLCQRYWIDLQ